MRGSRPLNNEESEFGENSLSSRAFRRRVLFTFEAAVQKPEQEGEDGAQQRCSGGVVFSEVANRRECETDG